MAWAQVNLRFGARPNAFSTPPGLRPNARRQLPSPRAEQASCRVADRLPGLVAEEDLGALGREAHEARHGLRHRELVVPAVVLRQGAGEGERREAVVGAPVPGVQVRQPEDDVRGLVDHLDVEAGDALLDLVPDVAGLLLDDDRLGGVDVALTRGEPRNLEDRLDLPVLDLLVRVVVANAPAVPGGLEERLVGNLGCAYGHLAPLGSALVERLSAGREAHGTRRPSAIYTGDPARGDSCDLTSRAPGPTVSPCGNAASAADR